MRYSIIFAAALLLGSCSSKQAGTPQSSASKQVAQKNFNGNVSAVASVDAQSQGSASNFSWYNSDGQKMSLADLKGKTVLVNFWATWCGPCKAELPDIESLSKEYSSKGLVVIGVSEDRGDNLIHDVSQFASQNGLTYQIVIDNDDIADAYGNINAIPTSFLVDKNGKVVQKWIGERNKTFFQSTVEKYLD